MPRVRRLPRILFPLLLGILGVFVYSFQQLRILSAPMTFALLNCFLLGYLGLEINRLRRVHADRWLLNPVVISSALTLAVGYGFANVIFLLPGAQFDTIGWQSGISASMVKLAWLALLAAFALWTGYWSRVAAHVSRPQLAAAWRSLLLPQSSRLRSLALPGLAAVSVGARLLQIRLGIFGYSSSYNALLAHASITQYLSLASSLGSLALTAAAIQFYQHSKRRRARRWFYGLLLLEVGFGVLSGFKSAVVMPFVIVILCRYLVVQRIAAKWLILSVMAVVVAYMLIEPFRMARNEDSSFRGTSVGAIVDTMADPGVVRPTRSMRAGVVLSLVARSNLTYPGSFGIDFKDATANLPLGSPNFLQDILLAPAYALIPRILWPSKPTGTLGLWYNQVVMGGSTYSSTAMGPITYLYLAGGAVAVFIGFFLLGIMQRFLFFVLSPGQSMPGAIVLLAMLGSIAIIGSSFDAIIVALCRELPMLILLQHIIFRRRALDRSTRAMVSPTTHRTTETN